MYLDDTNAFEDIRTFAAKVSFLLSEIHISVYSSIFRENNKPCQ